MNQYFFKYVCKDSGRVTHKIGGAPTDGQDGSTSKGVPAIDEIRYYQDPRYASASEAT